jgi:hypothetical protein
MCADLKFRNAYLVLAHDDVKMLNILTQRLVNTGYVHIHLDLKSRIQVDQVIKHPKVKVTKKIKVNWGGFSIVDATRLLADQALVDGATRLTLLSGLSYPIVSDEELLSFSKSHEERSGTWIVDLSLQSKAFYKRFTTQHFSISISQNLAGRISRKLLRIILEFRPKLDPSIELHPVQLTSGSQWWSVTSSTYTSGMKFSDSNPRIERYFKSIECSDESYFGSMFNHVQSGLVGHGTTFVNWSGKGGPKKITKLELEREITSKQFLFIRKIHSQDFETLSTGYRN